MRIEALGENALILRDLPGPAHALAERISRSSLGESVEAVPSYGTVGIYPLNPHDTVDGLREVLPAVLSEEEPMSELIGAQHELPVCYELGPDLSEAAEQLGVSPERLIELHSSVTYQCFALGFCPGFAYLGYLPDEIAKLPRRDSPRVRVAPGSVGITGRQTGVYPLERPGGWWLIGKCPLELVNLEDAYFPISAGDRVRFVPIDASEYERRKGERLA